MSFQYRETDKRGNPHIRLVEGVWSVDYYHYTSTKKLQQAFDWCDAHNSILYKIQVRS